MPSPTQSTVPIHLRSVAVTEVPLSTEPSYREIAATADGMVVFENKSALPRFRFAQELVPVRDVNEAHRLFQSPEFNKATTVTGMGGLCGNLGILLFSLLIGGLVTTIGYNPFFVALGVMDIIGAIWLWSVVRERISPPAEAAK